jgi:hypothetical protein
MTDFSRFSHLTFNDFRRLAQDDSLSRYEKIGFPDSYREGKEERIFADICAKLTRLKGDPGVVVDIGPGCTDLPLLLIDLCRQQGHQLILIDSEEMLAQLPDEPGVTKIAGFFPSDTYDRVQPYLGRVDVLLCYSVLHYIFVETSIFSFLDAACSLLGEGGQMLIGDIPNVSKRKRFFASSTGKAFHRAFMGEDADPEVVFNQIEMGKIDDAVVFSLLLRARAQGLDAFVLPQADDLPMANRREDLLILRP